MYSILFLQRRNAWCTGAYLVQTLVCFSQVLVPDSCKCSFGVFQSHWNGTPSFITICADTNPKCLSNWCVMTVLWHRARWWGGWRWTSVKRSSPGSTSKPSASLWSLSCGEEKLIPVITLHCTTLSCCLYPKRLIVTYLQGIGYSPWSNVGLALLKGTSTMDGDDLASQHILDRTLPS